MTVQEKIETGEGANALATLENIEEITAGRDRAIGLWLEHYDRHHAAQDAIARASIAGRMSIEGLSSDRYRSDDGGISVPFCKPDNRAEFEERITAYVDRRCWSTLMKRLNFDRLLDAQARKEFEESLQGIPPAFTAENCRATFGTLWAGRRDMYLRGIANVFMKMDRRFRSHDGFEIGWRLIISYAFSDGFTNPYWSNYKKRDTLDDVERIFRELDGLPALQQNEKISAKLTSQGPLPFVYEDEYFKLNCYKNRNVHFQFKRKDLLRQVNELLLEYYKPVEGDVGEGPSYEETLFHSTPAKNFGEFFSSQDVAERALAKLDIQERVPRVLEPSAGSGVLAKAAARAGAHVTCIEIQPGLAHELSLMGFPRVIQGDFLRMTPRPIYDYVLMNPPFDRGRDCDHVRHAFEFLKPGGTLVAVMSARAEFATDARHKALHELIEHRCSDYYGRVWEDLPERSFAHAGTNVNTVLLRLVKKH